jgi:hypothetical protein
VELKAPSSKNEFGCLKHDEINQMKAGDAQTISTALFAQSETLSIRMHSLVEQLYGTNDYLVKILEKNETPRARMIVKHCVKQGYLDEYGWQPPQPNPINQKLDVTGTQFVDDFSNEHGCPGIILGWNFGDNYLRPCSTCSICSIRLMEEIYLKIHALRDS